MPSGYFQVEIRSGRSPGFVEHAGNNRWTDVEFHWTQRILYLRQLPKFNYYEVSPFVQAKLGPVDLEGKTLLDNWVQSKCKAGGNDVDIDGLSAYVNAQGQPRPGLCRRYVRLY